MLLNGKSPASGKTIAGAGRFPTTHSATGMVGSGGRGAGGAVVVVPVVVVVAEPVVVVVVEEGNVVVVDEGSTVVVVDASAVVVVVVDSSTADAIPGVANSRKARPAAIQPTPEITTGEPGPPGSVASSKTAPRGGELRMCLPRAARIPGRLAIGGRHYPEIPSPQLGGASPSRREGEGLVTFGHSGMVLMSGTTRRR